MKYSNLIIICLTALTLMACGENTPQLENLISKIEEPGDRSSKKIEEPRDNTCVGTVNTSSSALNVRATPEFINNVCGQFERSTEVIVNKESFENNFIQIQTDLCGSEVAYVSKIYIAFENDCQFEDSEEKSDEDDSKDEDDNNTPRRLISMEWDGKHKDASLWTQFSMDALEKYGQEILSTRPTDILSFCPAFDQLDRQDKMMFWTHLLSVMTRYESFFNPSVQYKEAFPDANGNRVISRGLLQLSVESGRYFGCELENGPVLHDPKTNLICGVKIMNYWLQRDKVLSERRSGKWYGAARYWAVFRTYTNRDLVAQVRARSKTAEVCKL